MDPTVKKLVRYIDENLGFAQTAPSRQRLREMFPEAFKKTIRQRIVFDRSGVHFTIRTNQIYFKNMGIWLPYSEGQLTLDKERACLFYDLFQHPTEEVEESEI